MMKTRHILTGIIAVAALYACRPTQKEGFVFRFEGYPAGDTAFLQLHPDYRSPRIPVVISPDETTIYSNDSIGDLLLARIYIGGNYGTPFVMERGKIHRIFGGRVSGTYDNDVYDSIYNAVWGGKLFSDIMEASRLKDSSKTEAESDMYHAMIIERHNRRDSIVKKFLQTDTLGVGLSIAYILRTSAAPSEMGMWLDNHRRFSGDESYEIMRKLYENLSKTDLGMKLPDFTAEYVDGSTFSLYGFLEQFRGKALIVDFWASWCHACRAKVPHLKELYKQFHDSGLEILGVSSDKSSEPWIEAMKKDGSGEWVNVLDCTNAAGRSYGISGIPKTFVIDAEGIVHYFGVGGMADETEAVKKLLNIDK